MSSALKRLSDLASHLLPSTPPSPTSSSSTGIDGSSTLSPSSETYAHTHHIHQLSPTFFLWRAAQIEPDAVAVYHRTVTDQILRRTYLETADRSRGLAYYLKKQGLKRVGILAPNTPAFLEATFGIGAAGGVNVAINYRLKKDDIAYIFAHAEVEAIIVDAEFVELLDAFRAAHPHVPFIVDTDTGVSEGEQSGPYDRALLEGWRYEQEIGAKGWEDLETAVRDEDQMIALAYTSGTTARPKGVEYTHRSAYLASMSNVIESGLNSWLAGAERCHYLWTVCSCTLVAPDPTAISWFNSALGWLR
nr:acetate/butyrate--coa ligase aae7, peroxisomal [Quercus suber]